MHKECAKHGMSVKMGAFKTPKLIMDLCDKKNYMIHYHLLQFALKHGLVLRKVHRILSFHQLKWLKTYINYNTKQHKGATNAIGKDFYKLMNNMIFDKMMENVCSWKSVELIYRDQWAQAFKFASHPWMESWRIILKDQLIAIDKVQTKVTLNRPIIVGQAILVCILIFFALFESLPLTLCWHTFIIRMFPRRSCIACITRWWDPISIFMDQTRMWITEHTYAIVTKIRWSTSFEGWKGRVSTKTSTSSRGGTTSLTS